MSRRLGAKGLRNRSDTVFQLPDHGVRKVLRGRTAIRPSGQMTFAGLFSPRSSVAHLTDGAWDDPRDAME